MTNSITGLATTIMNSRDLFESLHLSILQQESLLLLCQHDELQQSLCEPANLHQSSEYKLQIALYLM